MVFFPYLTPVLILNFALDRTAQSGVSGAPNLDVNVGFELVVFCAHSFATSGLVYSPLHFRQALSGFTT
jgi:hypothetical protein